MHDSPQASSSATRIAFLQEPFRNCGTTFITHARCLKISSTFNWSRARNAACSGRRPKTGTSTSALTSLTTSSVPATDQTSSSTDSTSSPNVSCGTSGPDKTLSLCLTSDQTGPLHRALKENPTVWRVGKPEESICVACWETRTNRRVLGTTSTSSSSLRTENLPNSPPVGPGCDASPTRTPRNPYRANRDLHTTPFMGAGSTHLRLASPALMRAAMRVDGFIEPGSASSIGSDRLTSSRKCRRSSTSRRNFHNSSRPCQLSGLFSSRNAT